MKGYDDEQSDGEEKQRVVKTAKDKKLETLNNVMKDVANHLKINDFTSLMSDFEKFTEELQRDQDTNQGLIYPKGADGVLPLAYLRVLVKIEDAINDTTQQVKDKKVTLNKTNSVSLNKLKQKMKKYLQATGPQDNSLEQQIAKFREDPVWSEDERKAAKAAEKKKQEAKAAAKKEASEEEEEEEESYYDEEEASEKESEASEEEEEALVDIFKVPREQLTPAQRRLKWVKKDRLPQHLQQLLQQKADAKKQQAAKKAEKEVKHEAP